MRTLAVPLPALMLALAVPTVNADAPPTAREDVEETHELATLSEPLAWHLAGRPASFCVAPDSDSDLEDGHTLYDCRTADAVLRTVWSHAGQDAEDLQGEHTVEAVLRVLRHRDFVAPDGTRFDAFTEYRPGGARLCR